mmetsp:Transcript_10897/g.18865  ORF Transcript_10897/g.18865 Transcript_10897/m.18865 type:complete len:126 (+) Transcript_10897:410-787(+)
MEARRLRTALAPILLPGLSTVKDIVVMDRTTLKEARWTAEVVLHAHLFAGIPILPQAALGMEVKSLRMKLALILLPKQLMDKDTVEMVLSTWREMHSIAGAAAAVLAEKLAPRAFMTSSEEMVST